MMNENIELSQFLEKVEALEKAYWEVIDRLEQRLEKLEIVVAQLVPAYGEVATNVEVILSVLANATPEERQELQQALTVGRKKLIDALSYAAKQDETTT